MSWWDNSEPSMKSDHQYLPLVSNFSLFLSSSSTCLLLSVYTNGQINSQAFLAANRWGLTERCPQFPPSPGFIHTFPFLLSLCTNPKITWKIWSVAHGSLGQIGMNTHIQAYTLSLHSNTSRTIVVLTPTNARAVCVCVCLCVGSHTCTHTHTQTHREC